MSWFDKLKQGLSRTSDRLVGGIASVFTGGRLDDAALEELDIVCEFEQREGARNHQGGYVIRDWGAVRREWVVEQHRRIAAALEYPAQ